MVKIVGYALRESKTGKEFVSLQLQGDVELVQSAVTGSFYATARRCSVTSTFDEATAKSLVGTKLKGTIARVQCDAYDYTIPETGEVVSMVHTYQYIPEEKTDTDLMPVVTKRETVPA